MEKVIKSVQTIGLSGMKKSKINEIKIMGMSLPVYIIAAFVILYAAMTGILPENMVGALAIMMVLGSALNLMGNKIPIIRSYLGGGAVFCIFASSALATFGILPSAVVENCKDFMNNVGFLDFYIAALITGSILGMNRDLLKKAAVRFLPISFLSMACAILMAGLMGIITGRGFGQTILYIALPMMSGGMGAGVIPLSGIYSGATGADSWDHLPDDPSLCRRKCISNHLRRIDRKNWNDRSSYQWKWRINAIQRREEIRKRNET